MDLIGAGAAAVVAFLAGLGFPNLSQLGRDIVLLDKRLLVISALLAYSLAILTKRFGYVVTGGNVELSRRAVGRQDIVGVAGFTFAFLANTYPTLFLSGRSS